MGDRWTSTVGESSFEVESLNPLVVLVTRLVPNKDGHGKMEKRRREVKRADERLFLSSYAPDGSAYAPGGSTKMGKN